MDWKLIFVLTAFVIYFVYNAVALSLFGVPKSLSMTFYLFKEKKNWASIFFPIMMLTMAGALLPSWLEISEGSDLQFMAFLAASGILFTGAAPAFENSKLENNVHMASAIVAAIFALLWVILVANHWYVILVWLVAITVVALLTKSIKTSYIYWLETIAFLSTFTSVFAYLCR